MDPTKQKEIDDKMKEVDGTDNKAKLGANAILAVSLAVAKVHSPHSSAWSSFPAVVNLQHNLQFSGEVRCYFCHCLCALRGPK